MFLDGLKYLVVGAGFFGSVVAERIASDLGERVLVIDKRPHIGGNCHSEIEAASGIEYHTYGSHIFHTADREVWSYLQRFCSLNAYRHKVLTEHDGRVFQMPINLATINEFYGTTFTPEQARRFIAQEIARDATGTPANLEEKGVSQIGRALYRAFIRGYTAKQWETDPKELPAGIIDRLPVRFNYKTDYFDDPWQGIPLDGYRACFQRILDHPGIDLKLDTDFFQLRTRVPADCLVIYTGPIDQYFDYRYGALGWRTLRLDTEVVPVADFQGTAVMNYADRSVPYTRIHEFKHYHEERDYRQQQTVICREYSKGWQPGDEPYYPVGTSADRQRYQRYRAEAADNENLICAGRLGSYSYLNMDQVIAQALFTYTTRIKHRPVRVR